MISSREKAIETLCRLQERVSDQVMGYDHPNDCFCDNDRDPAMWRSSGESIAFIERWTTIGIAAMRPYVWAKRWVRRIRRSWEEM